MSTTLTIARRELRSSFNSPLAYIVICVGLLALGLFFFLARGGYWQADRATMEPMFIYLSVGLCLIVPALTMQIMAEEKRSGTLEMLITLPVKDHEVILGKFLGAWALILLLILATGLYPLMMFYYPWKLGALDFQTVVAGYVGLILYSGAAVSIGLLFSSLTDSQFVAFVVSLATLGCSYLFSWFADGVSNNSLRWLLTTLSLNARMGSFSRGLISTSDVIFFVSIIVGCLMAAFRALERRKWA